MSNGILLFAHNNKEIDYGLLAYISAKFAKKNLNVPISLVTNQGTKEWLEKTYNLDEVFDKIILTDNFTFSINQEKRYYDGSLNYKEAPFRNDYRSWAYDLTPYDNTLVVDVDLLIVNDRLKFIWDTDKDIDFMINRISFDISRDRESIEFERVSDHSIDFFWATAFFFRKTSWTKAFFGLCQHIVENYDYYQFIYCITGNLMRNDYVFSIAIHILGGFTNKINPPSLPCEIYYCLDRDELVKINDEKSFVFLIQKNGYLGEYTLAKTLNHNIHIMNKYSIIRQSENLLEVIND